MFIRVKLILLFSLLLTTTLPNLVNAQERPLLIVGEEWPPFEFLDENSDAVGIDIDIARHIFQKLGIAFEIQLHPWSRAWLMVEKGEADAVFSTSRKEKRKPYLMYPKEDMWISEYVFFVNKKAKLEDFDGYNDAKSGNYQIGVIRDNSYNDKFWDVFPNDENGGINDQLQQTRDLTLNFRKLERQRIDLFIADKTIGLYKIKSMELSSEVDYYTKPLFSKGYPMPFAIKSSYPDLANIAKQFETELIEMKLSGVYDEIVSKWIE